MAEWLNIQDAAAQWGISKSLLARLCRDGRIAGAQKIKGAWMIPEDAQYPADGRRKSDSVNPETASRTKKLLPLPIGISDYRKASTEYYYIDKTLMIRDFLDEVPMVSLFTRPRRFGKTLNMDMLRTFFEKTDEDTSRYFTDKKIWKCGKAYRDHQGKYPVIFLSFKDVKCTSWEETYDLISKLIVIEYKRHSELDSDTNHDQDFYHKVISGQASSNEFMLSLMILAKMLHEFHGIEPIVIIDEYDTPIQQGHLQGFYEEVVGFMRNLFSGGFKDNPHLSYGFLTGILRVAKESIFSGMNNLVIYSILDESFSQYFGFTHEEVKQIAAYYGVSNKYEELCQWYDGYRFGGSDNFNPWSIINYFHKKCKLQAFWVSTSSNDVIGEVLAAASTELYEELYALLRGETITAYIDTGVVYPQIGSDPSSVYSFLLVTGYLNLVNVLPPLGEGALCELSLPNQEIAFVYKKEILDKLSVFIPQSLSISIQKAIYSGNVDSLQKQMRQLLLQSVSSFDTSHEDFYHGLLLGLCAMMDNRYHITSNRESGEGRFDIQLMPKVKEVPGILIEVKATKQSGAETLKALAQTALNQIIEKHYESELRAHSVDTIFKYGVAFSGKAVEVCME